MNALMNCLSCHAEKPALKMFGQGRCDVCFREILEYRIKTENIERLKSEARFAKYGYY